MADLLIVEYAQEKESDVQMETGVFRILGVMPEGSRSEVFNVKDAGKLNGSLHRASRTNSLNGWLQAVRPSFSPGFGCATNVSPGKIVEIFKCVKGVQCHGERHVLLQLPSTLSMCHSPVFR